MNLTKSNKKSYLIFIALISFLIWVIPFSLKGTIDTSMKVLFDNIAILTCCVSFFFIITLKEDSFYAMPWVLFFPFTFTHGFDAATMPMSLYFGMAIVTLGIIIHLFRFPFKFKKGKLLYGFLAICFACIFGGLLVKTKYSMLQILIGVGGSLFLIFLYEFFISTTKKVSFSSLAFLMTLLGLYLIAQECVYYLSAPSFIHAFVHRTLNVGWAGIGNNIGLVLLFLLPFPLYLAQKADTNKKMVLYELLTILLFCGILLSVSRGSILIGAISSIALMIYGLIYFYKKDRKKGHITLIVLSSFLGLCILLFLAVYFLHPELKNAINDVILNGFNFLELNGRVHIYKAYIDMIKEQPIFGYGLLYSMDSVHIENHPQAFEWAHDTFLQATFSFGIIGLLSMIYHMVEKYLSCLKKINIEKIALLLAYLFSGAYGLFDVSYFFINYMVLLLVAVILGDSYLSSIYPEKLSKIN